MWCTWRRYLMPKELTLNERRDRIEELKTFLNLTAGSGLVNARPIVKELAELHGLKPSVVLKKAKR